MMKYLLIFLLFVFVFNSPGIIYAAEEEQIDQQRLDEISKDLSNYLPEVKLTPDIPFYFTKELKEMLISSMKRSAQSQYEYQKDIARSRLSEAYKMVEKEKYTIADKLFAEFEAQMLEVQEVAIKKANNSIQQESWRREIEDQWYAYKAVLDKMNEENIAEHGSKQEVEEVSVKRTESFVNGLTSVFKTTVTDKDYDPWFVSPIPLGK